MLMLDSCFQEERNMSVLIQVLVVFAPSDEALPQSLDISRPKLEKQTT